MDSVEKAVDDQVGGGVDLVAVGSEILFILAGLVVLTGAIIALATRGRLGLPSPARTTSKAGTLQVLPPI